MERARPESRRIKEVQSFFYAGVAQLARASAFQAEGREFESRLPLHYSIFTTFIAGSYFLLIKAPKGRGVKRAAARCSDENLQGNEEKRER